MNTLSFDTCLGACSVAAAWRAPDGYKGAYRFALIERGHAERLTPMIDDVMSEARFDFPALARIIVTTGPGTFTGQRVGIAAARALALATGAPVWTLSSLAVMAHTAAHDMGAEAAGKTIAVAVDARRGEIYFQCFGGPDLMPLGEPELTTPDDAARKLGARDAFAVGSGAALLADAGRHYEASIVARLPSLQPDVRFIPEGAAKPAASLPKPLYLRPPDAKPQDGAALERAP